MVRGFLALLLFSTAVMPHFVSATVVSEDIGELKIHDLLLRPYFMLGEGKQSNFSIGESSFALRWELEKKFAGVVRIGPESLINPSAHFVKTVPDEVTLVEAFAEYNDVYGRFRMGRLPVEFGLEGRKWERELVFPRSLLFQNRAMMLRDMGVAYDISQNNWYTGFVIHNGNSGDNTDGRTWYTARWGYKSDDFEIGATGQTGSTLPDATVASGDTLAGVDTSKAAKWRLAGLYGTVSSKKWEWSLESYMGELEQDLTSTKFATGHTDLSYMWTKRFSTHVRYDFFDPDLELYGDQQKAASLALQFSNNSHSSNLILVGTKSFGELHTTRNDEIRLIWSLSPAGIVRF